MKKLAAAAVLASVIPATGFAQDHTARVDETEKIRQSVKQGHTVIVTDDQGRLFTGRVESVAGSRLTLAARGRYTDVPYGEIVRIQRRGDSVIDGALIGFTGGAAIAYAHWRSRDTHGGCTPTEWFCSNWSGPDVGGFVALIGGAIGTAVPDYQWGLPEDLEPLRAACRMLVEGAVDVALFTTGTQVVHLLKVAETMGVARPVVAGLHNAVVASIGPTTSEELREHGTVPDIEASHPKMGFLVREAAERAAELLKAKRTRL